MPCRQDAAGAVVDRDDPPAPVQVDDAFRGLSSRAVTVVVRASARTSACRTRTNCRIGVAARDHRDPRGPPSSESAGSRGPRRYRSRPAVETHVHAVLQAAPAQHLVVGGRGLNSSAVYRSVDVHQTTGRAVAGSAVHVRRWDGSFRGTRAPGLRGAAPASRRRRREPGSRPSDLPLTRRPLPVMPQLRRSGPRRPASGYRQHGVVQRRRMRSNASRSLMTVPPLLWVTPGRTARKSLWGAALRGRPNSFPTSSPPGLRGRVRVQASVRAVVVNGDSCTALRAICPC